METKPEQNKAPDEQFCSSCGSIIKKEAEICPSCGVRVSGSSVMNKKDPGVAALLSGLTSGWAGQIYNGQIIRGVGIFSLQVVNVMLFFIFIGLLTFPLVWALGTYDAYNQAEKINAGEVQA